MKRILIVVGTRPNFVKITCFPKHLKEIGLDYKIVHTGQHYDKTMSALFFQQFGIMPDIFLGMGKGSQLEQISETIARLEKIILEYSPDCVVVTGDVNSTFAGAFVANRMGIKVAHVESGLRSFDTSMPEEWNRILTDAVTDFLFVTEQSGMDNLQREGKPKEKIFFVGNTMIDTLSAFQNQIDNSDVLQRFHLFPRQFILMTMHRPATVDSYDGLYKLSAIISHITKKYPLVFPVHPRTLKNISHFNLQEHFSSNKNLIITEPLDYFAFQKLIKESFCVITDSGGIQEETTFLQVPCLTLRANTERPITISLGTNELIPFDERIIEEKILSIEKGTYKKGNIPPLWDGKATERIVNILSRKLFQ